MTILPGDILIGGDVGFIDHIRADGTLVDQLSLPDEGGEPVRANGIDIGPDGIPYVAKAPPGQLTLVPHDVAYIPDGSGVLRIIQIEPGVAKLWKYDASDGEVLEQWSIETDDGWTTGLMRLDVAPDSRTVYYTDSGRTIFRFDISTGKQIEPPFAQLPEDSPNIYAGFTLLPDGGLVIAMSKTGNGPRNAVCLDGSRTAFWTDEVSPTGEYHVYKRDLDANGDMKDVYPKTGHLDYEVMCLACYLRGDARYGVHSKALTPFGGSVPTSWIGDVRNLGVGRVRVDIRYTQFPEAADCDAPDTTIDDALGPISVALAAYKQAGVEPLAVLAGGILAIQIDPDDPPNSFRPGAAGVCAATGQTYLEAFPARAAKIAEKLNHDAGVTCFEIWNEPNVLLSPDGVTENPQYIANPDDFARLVFDAANAIRARLTGVSVTIVTGGVFIGDDNPTNDEAYLTQTMRSLWSMGPACWQQIGVHNYRGAPANANVSQANLDSAFAADSIDPHTMWITEFGVKRACADPSCPVDEGSGGQQASDLGEWYDQVINPNLVSAGGTIDAAFWFSHESELDSVGEDVWNTWGLTNWDTDGGISPTQHWPSWEQLRMSTGVP